MISDIQKIQFNNDIDFDNIKYISEMLEFYLSTLENLIRGCPKEVYMEVEQLINTQRGQTNLIEHLLKWNPNTVENDDKMEIEGKLYSNKYFFR